MSQDSEWDALWRNVTLYDLCTEYMRRYVVGSYPMKDNLGRKFEVQGKFHIVGRTSAANLLK